MEIELLEIRDFLAEHHPFSLLPEEALEGLPRFLELSYVRRGKAVYEPGKENRFLYLIRTGAIEIRDEQGVFLSRRGEGETFGARSLLRGHTLYAANAIEDTLLYKLPKHKFTQLCDQYERFAYHYHADSAAKIHKAVNKPADEEKSGSVNLMSLPISDLLSENYIKLSPTTPINEAARVMTEKNVSAILVTDEKKLKGIVTERDMCSRCLATDMQKQAPISEIMTTGAYTIEQDEYAFQALMLMSRHNIRHLPVKHQGQLVGVIGATELMQRQSASPVYLVGEVYRQNTIDGLAEVSQLIPQALLNLVEADTTAHSIGHLVSSIGDAITSRLLQMAEEKLGPPPVAYCWLCFGSLARREQAAHSDQDNGLLLSDEYLAEEHEDYFKKLAEFVSDGLNACGYEYCPGEIMASNSKWRQPLSHWKRYFYQWINKPEPKALMHASIFFDMRAIYGESSLQHKLQQYVIEQSKKNRIFLAHMAGNALQHQTPLGFFRRFVLVHDGKHDNTLDLKHNGIVPIIDLARIYALASGVKAVNTRSRLENVGGKGEVSQQGADDLRDALELIAMTRLRHQARLIAKGAEANNYISPEELSNFERNHLKDAFEVVRTIQSALGQRFQTGRF